MKIVESVKKQIENRKENNLEDRLPYHHDVLDLHYYPLWEKDILMNAFLLQTGKEYDFFSSTIQQGVQEYVVDIQDKLKDHLRKKFFPEFYRGAQTKYISLEDIENVKEMRRDLYIPDKKFTVDSYKHKFVEVRKRFDEATLYSARYLDKWAALFNKNQNKQ